MANTHLAKKYPYIVIGVLIGLSLFYLFRNLALETSPEMDYHIGQDTRWQELHLMGKERNLSAFNQEVLTAIAKLKHFHIHFTATSSIEELEQGKLQGILTTLQPSYLNEQRLLFSNPYFSTGLVLIIPSNEATDGWNEKRKKIVGISSRSPMRSNLEQDPSIQIKIYDDILPALADLRERRIDGALFPTIPAYTYTETFYKTELKISTLPLTDEGLRLAVLKNQAGEELIQKFNEGLEEIKQNGTYDKILERWSLVNADVLQSVKEAVKGPNAVK